MTNIPVNEKTGELRIGVYICHCGSNIAGVINVDELRNYASTLPDVKIARHYMYMCSDPGQESIKKDIEELSLNRVVVAACSPTLHERTFRRVLEHAGLNPFLFEMANIREQDSWVHRHNPSEALEKAKGIINMATAKARNLEELSSMEVKVSNRVLVVGAGIAGISAALDLAKAGNQVFLVEKSATIGGRMAQFDKTFPTLDCSMCILTPMMAETKEYPNITLMTCSEVADVQGFVGNYKVKVRKNPRHVDINKCTGCGDCSNACPVEIPSEFDAGLSTRKAIYIPFPQAVPSSYVVDEHSCVGMSPQTCGKCIEACLPNAIELDSKVEEVQLDIDTIILSTGYDPFDASRVSRLGYGSLQNVITSLEFERLSNASGPTSGEIIMKNGEKPSSVAIIHCVGSRDENYNEYCSRVCCMAAMKAAHLIREKLPDAKVYEFYIDIRSFGKGYEEFYNRVQKEDVVFVRGKGAEVTDIAETPEEEGKKIVICEDTLLGSVRRIPVDLVVLSIALEPRKDTHQVAKVFHVSRSRDGFFLERHPKLAPVSTADDGIFIAGACQAPKDIPDTIAQAKGAASSVQSLISAGKYIVEPYFATVDEELCSGCMVCGGLCPYSAISYKEKGDRKRIAYVEKALCKGCGTCAAACPSGAMQQMGFKDSQLLSMVKAWKRDK